MSMIQLTLVDGMNAYGQLPSLKVKMPMAQLPLLMVEIVMTMLPLQMVEIHVV